MFDAKLHGLRADISNWNKNIKNNSNYNVDIQINIKNRPLFFINGF